MLHDPRHVRSTSDVAAPGILRVPYHVKLAAKTVEIRQSTDQKCPAAPLKIFRAQSVHVGANRCDRSRGHGCPQCLSHASFHSAGIDTPWRSYAMAARTRGDSVRTTIITPLTMDLDAVMANATTRVLPVVRQISGAAERNPILSPPRWGAQHEAPYQEARTGQNDRRHPSPPLASEDRSAGRPTATPWPDEPDCGYLRSALQVSDRLADLVLTASFDGFAHRSTVHNRRRLAVALGCAMLAELVLDDHITIDETGDIHSHGDTGGDDRCTRVLLHHLSKETRPTPVGTWLRFLSLDSVNAPALVWRRLVDAGHAREIHAGVLRRRLTFEFSSPGPPEWSRIYLLGAVTDRQKLIEPRATVLWRVLTQLQLTTSLDLPERTRARLDATLPPPQFDTLTTALEQSLQHLTTSF